MAMPEYKTVLDILTENNWVKRIPVFWHGEHCLVTASRAAGIEIRINMSPICQSIKDLFPTRSNWMSDFNDHPDTTWLDVVKVCEAAGQGRTIGDDDE